LAWLEKVGALKFHRKGTGEKSRKEKKLEQLQAAMGLSEREMQLRRSRLERGGALTRSGAAELARFIDQQVSLLKQQAQLVRGAAKRDIKLSIAEKKSERRELFAEAAQAEADARRAAYEERLRKADDHIAEIERRTQIKRTRYELSGGRINQK